MKAIADITGSRLRAIKDELSLDKDTVLAKTIEKLELKVTLIFPRRRLHSFTHN